MLYNLAIQTIHESITEHGILASSLSKENYNRIWSRDSVMTGITGVLIQDEKITNSFKDSLITLSNFQTKFGQIPSNVSFENVNNPSVSFGSISGRVDATTWWIIGACIYSPFDEEFKENMYEKIYLALDILNCWEMNNKGLLYAPMGGNWADEYLTYGYTLYDNVLRYWCLRLVGNIYNDEKLKLQSEELKIKIDANFNVKSQNKTQMHKIAFDKLEKNKYKYLLSSFAANGYSEKWDMAGNALALLLNINNENEINLYLNQLELELGHEMYPVFYPIIKENTIEWIQLEQNYNYEFKNKPYQFHNGGSWPIFLGWIYLAMRLKGIKLDKMKFKLEELMKNHSGYEFSEYWDTKNLEPKGTNKLCFSASGYLLMSEDINLEKVKSILF